MEFQYNAPRFRYRNGRHVGTVNVGEIIYIQKNLTPFRFTESAQLREPWSVEAWIPRENTYRDPKTGQHALKRCAGGHLALVRSLRDRRKTQLVADWILLACIDHGFSIPSSRLS